MALGREVWSLARKEIQRLLSKDEVYPVLHESLIPRLCSPCRLALEPGYETPFAVFGAALNW